MTLTQAQIIAASAKTDPGGAELALYTNYPQQWRWMKNKPADKDSLLSEEGREVMAILREGFGGYPENLKK